jgi:cytoskeletal protein CcmA (bactofilin family)
VAEHSKKARVVDGFTALKAAQRAAKDEPGRAKKPKPSSQAPVEAKTSSPSAARIGRTVMPTRHEIVCYECDYQFKLAGKAKESVCPKCRTLLVLTDHEIEGEWRTSVKTGGTIRLAPGAVLKTGELIGTDVVIEGRIEGGLVRAFRWLEFGKGASFREESVSGPDLRVAAGGKIALKGQARYRNVEVAGELKAALHASGLITVLPGGLLRGEVHAAHLAVRDGGGLKASLRIGKGEA